MLKVRVLLTGGGTGGHIYPLMAVSEELESFAAQNNLITELRYLGVPGSFRQELEAHHIRVSGLASSKLRRYFALQNFLDAPKFVISLFQALWRVYWFMPDVLFSKGGTGSLAVIFACRFYKVPIFVHESDAVPGITNQIAARYAKRIAISFSGAARYFEGKNAALTGNPVRKFIFGEQDPQETAKKLFEFDPAKPLILVLGGSQGATRINDFMFDNLSELITNYQILHQVGENNYEQAKGELAFSQGKLSPEEKGSYKIVPYFEKNIKDAISAADLVIARAGSGTIFEIAAVGRPAVLIPLPEAANDHQRANAYEFAGTGAAIVIEQDNLLVSIFFAQLKKLFENKELLKSMAEASKKFSKPDAAKLIAAEIIRVAKTYSL